MRAEPEGPLFTEGMYRDRDARNAIRDLEVIVVRAFEPMVRGVNNFLTRLADRSPL